MGKEHETWVMCFSPYHLCSVTMIFPQVDSLFAVAANYPPHRPPLQKKD